MEAIIQQLSAMIGTYAPLLQQPELWNQPYTNMPGKWDRRQVLGHLVDSAQTNIRRFVVAQYEDTPHIVYQQEQWVALSGYTDYNTTDLVQLWILLNKHMLHILRQFSPGMGKRLCRTESMASVDQLVPDYILHCRHHLHQVLELEPVAYPA